MPPSRRRPAWWCREALLHKLEDGEPLAEILRQAVDEMTDPVTTETLKNDVRKWRNDEEFGSRYQRAISDSLEERGLAQPAGGAPPAFDEQTQNDFLELYRESLNLSQAAYDCGVSPSTVMSRINPESSRYDPVFYDRFLAAEGNLHAGLYDKVTSMALQGHPAMLRFAATARVPYLFANRQELKVSGRVDHHHRMALDADVLHQLQKTRRSLTEHRPAIDDEVVDAEVVDEVSD